MNVTRVLSTALILLASSVAVANPTSQEMLNDLNRAMNECAIPNITEIDKFLTTYAMEVRSEKNLDIRGQMSNWSFGILGGLNLLNPLTLIKPGQFFANILGGLGGISAGGGTGEIRGEGFQHHADKPHYYVLTIFDQDAWKVLDSKWRNFNANDSKVRGYELARGLKQALDVLQKAGTSMANLYHFGRMKTQIAQTRECLDQAVKLKGKLQFVHPDQGLISNIGNDIQTARAWIDSRAVSVFVVAPSKDLSIYVSHSSGIEYQNERWGLYTAKSYFAVIGLGGMTGEEPYRRMKANDNTFDNFFHSQLQQVKKGIFAFGSEGSQEDLSHYFIYMKTDPKRLSQDWSGL